MGCQDFFVEKPTDQTIQPPSENDETPIDNQPTDEPNEPSDNGVISSDDLDRLQNLSILPNLRQKIDQTVNQQQSILKKRWTSSPVVMMNIEVLPFSEETTDYFYRTWIYMMINEDMPLLQSWGYTAKENLNQIVSLISEELQQHETGMQYGEYYQLQETGMYVQLTQMEEYEDGIKLIAVDLSDQVQPGQFIYTEVQSYTKDEVAVSVIRYSLVAPYNHDHYISVHIENHGDNKIQIHDITEISNSNGKPNYAGRNFQFEFSDTEFTIWRVDHGFYYTDEFDTVGQISQIGFQVYEKNENNEVIDYNSGMFVTYLPNFNKPSETMTTYSLYNEVYISPYLIDNLTAYEIEKQVMDSHITKLFFDGIEVEGKFGDAFGQGSEIYKVTLDINNRYIRVDPKDYLTYLIDRGASFKIDLFQILDRLKEVEETYRYKSAFGFQPLVEDKEIVYNYFMDHYYVGKDMIEDLRILVLSN